MPVWRKKKLAPRFKAVAAPLDQRDEGHRAAVAAVREGLPVGASGQGDLGQSRAVPRIPSSRALAFHTLVRCRNRKPRWDRWERPLNIFVISPTTRAAGLFHCSDVEGLPGTTNELEHCFGVARVHERRATGRRGAIPGVVVRGSVRVITAVVTRKQSFSAEELQPKDSQRWRELRAHLPQCEETRRQQVRFRKDPAAYLTALEAQLLR